MRNAISDPSLGDCGCSWFGSSSGCSWYGKSDGEKYDPGVGGEEPGELLLEKSPSSRTGLTTTESGELNDVEVLERVVVSTSTDGAVEQELDAMEARRSTALQESSDGNLRNSLSKRVLSKVVPWQFSTGMPSCSGILEASCSSSSALRATPIPSGSSC